jgi:hypothetical protein
MMVRMPGEFVATKYPGYFWNTVTQTLFTAKLGVLRELKYHGPNRWNDYAEAYRISDNGVRKNLYLHYLRKLKSSDAVFPVEYTFVVGENDERSVHMSALPPGAQVVVRVR